MKRIFLVVLDSVGIGEMPDAADFGDVGSNTVKAAATSEHFAMPNMQRLGLFDIDGICEDGIMPAAGNEMQGMVARMKERSKGKDTTTGHWEIAGLVSDEPMPVFPEGFPKELLDALEEATGRPILCNKPYSGTEVIKDYGQEHCETGALIVYTSADSVLQIAAHEEVIPVAELYEICETARRICTGKWGVGRVIARPFVGTYPNYTRTSNRHDFSVEPPAKTMLNYLAEAGYTVAGVGKINDIFAGSGITEFVRTKDNAEGIERTLEYMQKDFTGLCFVNLVDFDMLYGHRNDVDGYAKALAYFDSKLPELIAGLQEEDLLMITADHGCDPATPSTDHSREYVPLVMYQKNGTKSLNLGTRDSFADIGATVLDCFGVQGEIAGTSFKEEILRKH